MALDTYAHLQTSIADWLMRPGDATIAAIAPDLIILFEEEARDRLKTRFNETTTTLATVAGTATVALPAMFEAAREMLLEGQPNRPLVYVTPEEMDELWPLSSAQGKPENFTIVGTNFRFAPVPDSIYSIDCTYMQGIPALTGAAPTNWLLTNYPSLYIFGSLAMGDAYIGDDDRVQGWLQMMERGFERILLADMKARWSGSSLQIKTDTGNPP